MGLFPDANLHTMFLRSCEKWISRLILNQGIGWSTTTKSTIGMRSIYPLWWWCDHHSLLHSRGWPYDVILSADHKEVAFLAHWLSLTSGVSSVRWCDNWRPHRGSCLEVLTDATTDHNTITLRNINTQPLIFCLSHIYSNVFISVLNNTETMT